MELPIEDQKYNIQDNGAPYTKGASEYIKYLIEKKDDLLVGEFFIQTAKGEKKVSGSKAADILCRDKDIRSIRFFNDGKVITYYNKNKSCFQFLKQKDVLNLLMMKLKEIGGHDLITSAYLKEISESLSIGNGYEKEPFQLHPQVVVFKNKVYSLRSGKVYNKRHYLWYDFNELPFDYPDSHEIPRFNEFINFISDGHQDRKDLIRVMLYRCIHMRAQDQRFIYIWGVAGSGKSALENVFSAVAGSEWVTAIDSDSLSKGGFDLSRLADKKLILMSDSTGFCKDPGNLKRITGGDLVHTKIKFKEGYLTRFSGLIIISSNFQLEVEDTGGAIARRVIVFPMNKVPTEKKEILYQDINGKWNGWLKDEIGGIWHWGATCPVNLVQDIMVTGSDYLKSLEDTRNITVRNISTVMQWIESDCINEGESPIGPVMKPSFDNDEIAKREGYLYHSYKKFCIEQGLTCLPRPRFACKVEEACNLLNFSIKITRDSKSQRIKGITIKPSSYYSQDRLESDPYLRKIVDLTSNNNYPKTYVAPDIGCTHFSLTQGLVEKYKNLLDETPLKLELQKSKYFLVKYDIHNHIFKMINEKTDFSEKYYNKLYKILEDGIQRIIRNGPLAFSYEPLGSSVRIQPQQSGKSMIGVKSSIRKVAWRAALLIAKKKGYTIRDYDLKSSYLSTLIGLYPIELQSLIKDLGSMGLWDRIYKEFEDKGKKDLYEKKNVKIAVYSSFFGGGKDVFKKAILENYQKDIGMEKAEFQKLDDYSTFLDISVNTADMMKESSIIRTLKKTADNFSKKYMGKEVIGPTGHMEFLSSKNNPTVYSNFLIGFEFAIKAQVVLQIKKELPDLELLYDWHDGITIAVPEDKVEKLDKLMEDLTPEVGFKLGLKYPQKFELAWSGEDLEKDIPVEDLMLDKISNITIADWKV